MLWLCITDQGFSFGSGWPRGVVVVVGATVLRSVCLCACDLQIDLEFQNAYQGLEFNKLKKKSVINLRLFINSSFSHPISS